VEVLEPAAGAALPEADEDEPELPQPTSDTARTLRIANKVSRDFTHAGYPGNARTSAPAARYWSG
jgi:hypothetical protein